MKPLLLLAMISIAFAAQSQTVRKLPDQKQIDAFLKKYRNADQPSLLLNDSATVLNGNFLSSLKKPGVYRLRQDNMPCIVPDTKNIAAMPNAWKGTVNIPYRSQKPAIPNPSKPNLPSDIK